MGSLRTATLAYIAGLALVAVIVRAQDLSWQDDLGVALPTSSSWIWWLIGWFAWLAITEVVTRRLHLPQPHRRNFASVWEGLWWAGTLVILAPITEETIFRGLLYWRVSETPLGVPGAIVLGAVAFSLLHLESPPGYRVLIAIDGVLYGLARAETGSLIVPMLLHTISNAYAVWQRLHAAEPNTRVEPSA